MHEAVPAVSKTVMRSERDGLGAVPSGATIFPILLKGSVPMSEQKKM